MPGSKLLLSLAAWTARCLPMPARRWVYRHPRLAGLVRRRLNQAAPHGLSQVAVAAGGLAGLTLLLDLQTEKDYWLGTYEPELQTAAAQWVRPSMVVYDVGANVGYISLLLARLVGDSGRVFAFEALPANLLRLRANLSLNDIGRRVSVIDAAVVDEDRPVRFLVGPSDDMGKAEGSAGRQGVTYGEAVAVSGVSLDGFVYRAGNPPPNLVKMDIEGGEVLALPGMHRLLHESRPIVLVELHGPEAARAAWDAFSHAGYQVQAMQRGYTPVSRLDDLDWKSYLVALPETRKVGGR